MLDNSAEQSQHQAGIAMDVQTPYGEADDWLAQIYEWGFEWGYKISETAIHVDTRWTTSNFPTLYVLDQNPYVFTSNLRWMETLSGKGLRASEKNIPPELSVK
jgi:hypothetical protein